jgi:carbon storage regulator
MLVLTRKTGQSLYIDNNIVITITRIEGNRVKVGIEAPMQCSIVRGELKEQQDAALEMAESH